MSESPWRASHKYDKRALPLADAHYNRRNVGAPQFVPPGRALVMLTEDADAVWITSWPYAEFVRHDWPGAWVNSLFRRDGSDVHASELIRLAVAHTRHHWPAVPDLGMVTFVDPRHVPGTKVRGVTVYGWSYLKAGFRHVGYTRKEGLVALQLLPADMPDPAPIPAAQLEMFA